MAVQTSTFKGARYIPKFADPIEWSAENSYEAIESVQHNGFTYLSKQPVPIGVEITNTEFWLEWADPNAQMEQLRQDVAQYAANVEDLSRVASRSFETVADMKAYGSLVSGDICHTNGFHASGDGGAAWYVISATGTANEMDVIACGELFANLIIANDSVTPEMFGAYGDGVHDDSGNINRCFAVSKNIKFLDKTYAIQETLNFVSTEYFTIIGSGNRTIIKALSQMESMFNFVVESSDFSGHKTIADFALDGSNLAINGMNCTDIRYCTFEKIYFDNIDNGIVISNWVNRINNCDFSHCKIGCLIRGGSLNNFVIFECNFNNSDIGIKCEANAHDINIINCSFDVCKKTAILMSNGCDTANIEGNYFEACGKDGSVEVQTAANTTVNKNGTIIVHGNYLSPYNVNFKNLNIDKNTFIDCYLNNIICASQLASCLFENNAFWGNYNYICELFWKGSPEVIAVQNVFCGVNNNKCTFAKPILLNTDTNEKQNNIVCRIKNSASNENGDKEIKIDVAKLVYYNTQQNIQKDGFYNGSDAYTLESSFDYTLNVDLSETTLINRIVSVSCFSKGVNTNNGLQMIISIDGTQVFSAYGLSNDVWKNTITNRCFYVPETAETLTIRLKPVYNTSNVKVSDVVLTS